MLLSGFSLFVIGDDPVIRKKPHRDLRVAVLAKKIETPSRTRHGHLRFSTRIYKTNSSPLKINGNGRRSSRFLVGARKTIFMEGDGFDDVPFQMGDLGVSKNRGTPKSSILIGFSIINHPFSSTPLQFEAVLFHMEKLYLPAIRRDSGSDVSKLFQWEMANGPVMQNGEVFFPLMVWPWFAGHQVIRVDPVFLMFHVVPVYINIIRYRCILLYIYVILQTLYNI